MGKSERYHVSPFLLDLRNTSCWLSYQTWQKEQNEESPSKHSSPHSINMCQTEAKYCVKVKQRQSSRYSFKAVIKKQKRWKTKNWQFYLSQLCLTSARSKFLKISLVQRYFVSDIVGYLAEDRVLPYLQMREIAKGKKYESCHPSRDVLCSKAISGCNWKW